MSDESFESFRAVMIEDMKRKILEELAREVEKSKKYPKKKLDLE